MTESETGTTTVIMNWIIIIIGNVDRIIPPIPRRWKINNESGKRIKSHNDRTTDIHDEQG